MKRAAFALQANRARLTERFVKKEKAQPEEEDEPVEEYDPVRNPAVVLEPHEVRGLPRPPGADPGMGARGSEQRPHRVGLPLRPTLVVPWPRGGPGDASRAASRQN